MYKKGYKVLYRLNNKLYSCNFGEGHVARIEYKKGKNKPKKDFGPLAVFKTKQQAFNFAFSLFISSKYFKVLKVKYKKSKESSLWYMNYGVPHHKSINLPEGTDFADKVYIKELI